MTSRQIHTIEEKWSYLNQFDPRRQTWLVSDITSKIHLQRRLLESHGQIEDRSVLRASELWRQIAWHHFPDYRIVSMDLIKALIQRELRKQKLPWAQGPGTAHTLAALMAQFLPLLIHDRSGDLMAEWFQQHPDSLMRWGHWYQLAIRIWRMIEDEKMLPNSWLPAFLLSHNDEQKILWPRPLVVDLSGQLTGLEKTLFGILEAVEILMPAPAWGLTFQEELRAYAKADAPASAKAGIELLRVPGDFRVGHFSSPLAEVKDAVATVRQWLDSGIATEKIALIAPDIEIYWPLLADALKEEGIPVDKAVTVPLHGLPSVQMWLAQLRLALGHLRSSDLELVSFSEPKGKLSYDRFKQLFTNVYSAEQIEPWFREHFRGELKAGQVLSRDQFVARAAGYWIGEDIENLERAVKALLEDAPPTVRFLSEQWFDWLEAWVGKIEISIRESEGGINCVNLSSTEWLSLDGIFCFGMNEEALRTFTPHGISHLEADQIERDLGVIVAGPEGSRQEFELRWLLDRPNVRGVLSCPVTDPEGGPVTPSRIWLVQNSDPRAALKKISAPMKSRWDEIQQANLAEIAAYRSWPSQFVEDLNRATEQDLGRLVLEKFGASLRPGLSAHQLESYIDCPFLFAARKLFHLSDLAAFDLDLDHMTKGRLVHKLFERLTVEPRRWEWSDQELAEVVDRSREELEVPDFGVWNLLRGRFVEMAKKFLNFERGWRERFPKTKTVARELRFQVAWSEQAKRLIPRSEAAKDDYLFSGVIDRVDSDGDGEYVILDYKSSARDISGASRWVANGSFQLALYVAALENGLTELPKGRVRGAFYFNTRDFSRDRGMHQIGENQLIPPKGPLYTALSEEQCSQVVTAVFEKVSGVVSHIAMGEFAPRPKNIKTCPKCEWRWLCRAPHLN